MAMNLIEHLPAILYQHFNMNIATTAFHATTCDQFTNEFISNMT